MDVAICSSFVPFVYGGGRFIVEWLEEMLELHGHRVERLYLPYYPGPDRMFSQMTAFRMMDVGDRTDRLIAIRPPAHVIPHPAKVLWFIHHFREYYDMWDVARPVPDNPTGWGVRDRLIEADNTAFAESRHVFTNSRVVADRLKRYNGVDGEVLYPPIYRPERFRCDGHNDEIVYICRVEEHKQQHLFVEAMRHVRTGVKLRLCGTGLQPAYLARLQATVDDYGLADKVTLELDWISEELKADRFAAALATIYAPYDEDSYGYPSLEASHSRKAILTTTNSGGVLELVEDGVNGYIVEPDAEAIADAFDRLYADRARTIAMGVAAEERLGSLRIDWSHVVTRLLA